MSEARVRLLFHNSLGTRERLAALAGAKAFKKFGVICDCTDTNDRKATRHVKAGKKLRAIISAENPVARAADFAYESLWALIYSKTIYGLGITPHLLLDGKETGEKARSVGLSLPGIGGVLSVYKMLETRGELGDNAIAAAVRHELGHVLGMENHCTHEKCIMQANENYADFIERFVKPALDFCRDCQARISVGVNRAMLP